jgi:pimeloyl-ACP methyl ester carboxylesterase
MTKFYRCLLASLLLGAGIAPLNGFGQYLYIRPVSIVYDSKAYWEYLPVGYNSNVSSKYPLMVYIHGAGDYGYGTPTDMKLILRSGPPRVMSLGEFPDSFSVGGQSFRFIVIAPQFYQQPSVTDIDSVINFCIATYKVDLSRIYLTGLSMGGGVTWDYAGTQAANANRLAAIVPVAGDIFPDSLRGRVMTASNLPVWATHNSGDPDVPVEYSIQQVTWINDAPSPNPLALITIFDTTGHDAWTETYSPTFTVNNRNVYEWMLSHSRAGSPPVMGIGRTQYLTLPDTTATVSGSASVSSGAIISHVWTFVSGPKVAVISNPTYNVTNVSGMTAAGIYVFKFSATDNANLTSSLTTQIIVDSALVKPAGADSALTSAVATVLLASPDSSSLFDQPLSIFPNPTGGAFELHVNNPLTGRMKVDVFSQTGNLVREFVLTKTTAEMDTPLSLDGVAPGDYVVVATIGNWRRSRKLLKF